MSDIITSIQITWDADDVRSLDSELTDEECSEVLKRIDKNHDANEGVNWDVLDYWIDFVKNKQFRR